MVDSGIFDNISILNEHIVSEPGRVMKFFLGFPDHQGGICPGIPKEKYDSIENMIGNNKHFRKETVKRNQYYDNPVTVTQEPGSTKVFTEKETLLTTFPILIPGYEHCVGTMVCNVEPPRKSRRKFKAEKAFLLVKDRYEYKGMWSFDLVRAEYPKNTLYYFEICLDCSKMDPSAPPGHYVQSAFKKVMDFNNAVSA